MILYLFVLTEKNNTVKSEAPIKCNNLRFKVKSSAVPVGMCYYSLNCSVHPIKTVFLQPTPHSSTPENKHEKATPNIWFQNISIIKCNRASFLITIITRPKCEAECLNGPSWAISGRSFCGSQSAEGFRGPITSRSAERGPADDDVARQREHASVTSLNCVLWRGSESNLVFKSRTTTN